MSLNCIYPDCKNYTPDEYVIMPNSTIIYDAFNEKHRSLKRIILLALAHANEEYLNNLKREKSKTAKWIYSIMHTHNICWHILRDIINNHFITQLPQSTAIKIAIEKSQLDTHICNNKSAYIRINHECDDEIQELKYLTVIAKSDAGITHRDVLRTLIEYNYHPQCKHVMYQGVNLNDGYINLTLGS